MILAATTAEATTSVADWEAVAAGSLLLGVAVALLLGVDAPGLRSLPSDVLFTPLKQNKFINY